MAKKSNFFKFAGAPAVKWSRFNNTHDNVLTADFFNLNPIFWDVLPPGGKAPISVSSYCRCEAFAAPIFSNIKLKTRVFAVPVRKCIPWAEEFFTSLPSDNLLEPYCEVANLWELYKVTSWPGFLAAPGSLADYLGVPDIVDQMYRVYCGYSNTIYDPTKSFTQKVQYILSEETNHTQGFYDYIEPILDNRIRLLPFIAYQKVFHDWFSDLRFAPDFSQALFDFMQDNYSPANPHIQDGDTFPVTFNGVTSQVEILQFLFTRRPVLYGKDYFTTCSDGQQAGPALSLLADKLDLYGNLTDPSAIGSPITPLNEPQALGEFQFELGHIGIPQHFGEVYAKLNQADLITPAKLRWQMALQRYLERMNISGNRRYTDVVLGQYGIRVPDPFLQRSIYIGGSSTDVQTTEVVATADGSTNAGKEDTFLGEYAGRGVFRGRTPGMSISVSEHVVVLAVDVVLPQTYYSQGLPRKLSNLTLLDWPTPVFAHVGEEPVYKKELYLGAFGQDIFGYQTRYGSYKFSFDEVHGDFKSTLKFWRTGREFGSGYPYSEPSLGFDFLEPKASDGNERIFTKTKPQGQPFRIFHRISYRPLLPLPHTIENGRIG